MKQQEITLPGHVTTQGKLMMAMSELNEFTKKWKNARIIATFRAFEPEASLALRYYYFHYVVPTMKQALWDAGDRKTDEQTELYLRECSPIMYRQQPDLMTGKYVTTLREIAELGNAELIEHIEFIKEFAAENFYIYIKDPNEE